jgi:ABC-2 type transport system permease protein
VSYFLAELSKLVGQPAVRAGSVVTVVAPAVIAALNGTSLAHAIEIGDQGGFLSLSTVDSGFSELAIGVVGVLIIAVVSVSSEYARTPAALGRTRQLSSTLVAMPVRTALAGAKIAVLVAWVLAISLVAIPAALVATRLSLGSHATAPNLWHAAGVAAFYLTMALLAQAVTTVLRSGVLPLVVFLANSSVVSVGMLLLQVTSWAKYLPDIAATSLMFTEAEFTMGAAAVSRNSAPLGAATAVCVLLGWSALSVAVTVAVWARRDA